MTMSGRPEKLPRTAGQGTSVPRTFTADHETTSDWGPLCLHCRRDRIDHCDECRSCWKEGRDGLLECVREH